MSILHFALARIRIYHIDSGPSGSGFAIPDIGIRILVRTLTLFRYGFFARQYGSGDPLPALEQEETMT